MGEMKEMNKIEKQLSENEHKCYIGIRESDIYYCKNYFSDIACIFSTVPSKETFSIRHNQNIDHREIFPFFPIRCDNSTTRMPHFIFIISERLIIMMNVFSKNVAV